MRDVTIIGAGPAGSLSAILLARRGWDVTLIEQHRFPRDKVCGECLSAIGIDVLHRHGLLPGLQHLGATPLTHAAIHAPDGASARFPLPRPMCGISRRLFDQHLLDAAQTAGANLRQPVRCESMASMPTLSLRIRDLQSNVLETFAPSWVIIADGKSALGDTPAATGDLGIKAHFVGVDGPRDTIELFGGRGAYGGLAAIEEDRWNAAFSIPVERLRHHRGDIEAAFVDVFGENRVLARRLTATRRAGPWLASPLPRFAVRKRWPDGVIPVGNAAAALEPIGGEGMGLALRSAEIACEMLQANPTRDGIDGQVMRQLLSAYDQLWRARRVACRGAAMFVSSPRFAALAGSILTSAPSIAQLTLHLIGKTGNQPMVVSGEGEAPAEPTVISARQEPRPPDVAMIQ